jgi:type IV secretion system protein VirB10
MTGYPNPPNTVEDKAPKPKGVIPKNAQSLVIIGVAVLMIVIMWLTGGGKKSVLEPVTAPPPPPAAAPTDPRKIQSFKQSIQAEQHQALLPQTMQRSSALTATGGTAAEPNPNVSLPSQTQAYPPTPSASVALLQTSSTSQPSTVQAADPIKAKQKLLNYQSLFASNVALTYREGGTAKELIGSPSNELHSDDSQSPAGSAGDLQELRDAEALALMGAPPAWRPQSQSSPQPDYSPAKTKPNTEENRTPSKPVNPDVAQPGEFNASTGKKYVLFEGTIIPTVLMNRLNGSFAGPVNCLVTQDIYSQDRQHVLVPAGSKVLGEARQVHAFGQERLAAFFHRLIMPDGYSVNLDQFKGLDQSGATALHDKVNNHYAKIFGASLAVGILGGLAGIGTGPILTESYLDQVRTGFGQSMAMTGEQIMNRFLNLMPMITIREGTRVEVYLSNDLLLPDYRDHTMPADF